jgi:putative ABC transport system permease protein
VNLGTLAWRSLVHYRRRQLVVGAGVAVACTVLTGALLVGDSVRSSLRRLSLMRLGSVTHALEGGERFFRAELASEIRSSTEGHHEALLLVQGTAASGDGTQRLPRVQMTGVDPGFWDFGRTSSRVGDLGPGEAAVGAHTARALGIGPGAALLLRARRPRALHGDVSLSRTKGGFWSERVIVRAVVPDEGMGRFSLRVSQIPAHTVFLQRTWLARRLGRPGRANAMLASLDSGGEGALESLRKALRRHWRLEDEGLRIRAVGPKPGLELVSERVFLDDRLVGAAQEVAPGAREVLSYFVNELRFGSKATPYSFVSAPGLPVVPGDMADDEILINDWLARDLGAGPGDRIELAYYVLGPLRKLTERRSSFRVRAVLPLAGPAADRTLMPEFPGLSDVDDCTDWDTGIPIDLDRVREVDEKYWDEHRGTPKAFLTLRAAKALWANPWGSLTSVRFDGGSISKKELGQGLLSRLSPETMGLGFRDVRSEALAAGSDSVDFGQLFLGLSFFLIVAALLLTSLLFALDAADRRDEAGTLLALGFGPSRLRALYLLEALVLVFGGCIPGAAGAVLYNEVVLLALGSLWRDAVAGSALWGAVEPRTLAAGVGITALCSLTVLWAVNRFAFRTPVHILQRRAEADPARRRRTSRIALVLCLIAAGGAVAVIATQSPGRGRGAAGAFFGAGSLALLSGLALLARLWLAPLRPLRSGAPGPFTLGRRQLRRRPGRSLAAATVLSCGVFLVLAVGANRHDPGLNPNFRSSGTGGFDLYGETALPIAHDLGKAEGRRALGLDAPVLRELSVVQLRARPGDDASCLNLNRVPRPRLLGVDPRELGQRRAFTFARVAGGPVPGDPWSLLDASSDDGCIPGVADDTVIIWGLGKDVGDTLGFQDESGRDFRVRLVGGLANSVFQGSILISQKHFQERFPSVVGTSVFLIDVPSGDGTVAGPRLRDALEDFGIEVSLARDRLAGFYAVENTYLSIFLLLGGLGLVLGSVGLGVVVMRNVLERRGELALLRAVGFSRSSLLCMLLWEHGLLFCGGTAAGAGAAALAVIPSLSSPGAPVSVLTLGLWLGVIAISGLAWIGVAAWIALRGDLVPALRGE